MTNDDCNWRLGTMGFSYGDWAGPFYPRDLKPGDYLSYYARYFDAVELDTTFHATPPAQRVRRWAASVPDHFRFCVKAPRAVTHEPPLAGAAPAMREFLDAVGHFGPKLAAVLLQFPPSFGGARSAELEQFLSTLPGDVRFAVELRNRTWGTQHTLAILRRHRCCLVSAEYLSRPRGVIRTADFLYVRWIGQHGRFETHGAERADVTESLNWWRDELRRRCADPHPAAAAGRTVYGFFNNDYAGYGVGTCVRFKAMLGLPAPAPGPADRGELFG